MGTKHIRHLVTELAARLSDRDFLRKAGISRRTMQEIFVRDKWEEALESLFPTGSGFPVNRSWSCATQSFGPCPGSRRRAGSPLPINFPLTSCIRIRSFPKRRRPMPGARMFT